MVDVARDREVEGDLCLHDLGHGLPLRPGTFDGAISISAVQWLCNAVGAMALTCKTSGITAISSDCQVLSVLYYLVQLIPCLGVLPLQVPVLCRTKQVMSLARGCVACLRVCMPA